MFYLKLFILITKIINTEPRCKTTNENGVGTLTINDVRESDAGAYSCEALNSQGRVFAVPDAIIYVYDNKYEEHKCDTDGSYTIEEPCHCKVYFPNQKI